MEVGVAAAPVRDLGEGVSSQDVLGGQKEHEAAWQAPLSPALADRNHFMEDLESSEEKKYNRKRPAPHGAAAGSSCFHALLWTSQMDNQESPGGDWAL